MQGSVCFNYFTITTDNADLWSIKDGGNNQLSSLPSSNYNTLQYKPDNTTQTDTIVFSLNNYCNNNTYYVPTNSSFNFNSMDILNVHYLISQPKMFVKFNTSDNQCDSKLMIGQNSIKNNSYSITGTFAYNTSEAKTCIGTTNEVQVDFYDEKKYNKFITCSVSFIQCGYNCTKCDTITKICLQCKEGYSFFETVEKEDCSLKTELEQQYTNYYYNEPQNVFETCYDTCTKCKEPGDSTIHNCIGCNNNLFYLEVNKINGYSVYNCVEKCTAPYPYLFGMKCVEQCPDNYSDIGEHIYVFVIFLNKSHESTGSIAIS